MLRDAEVLEEVLIHARILADHASEYRALVSLGDGACAGADAAHLRQVLPGLPDSYLDAARQLNLFRLTIGNFVFSPPGAVWPSLREALIERNGDSHPRFEDLRARRLYDVGVSDEESLVIAGLGSPTGAAGAVFRADIEAEDLDVQPVAPSIASCLLLAIAVEDVFERSFVLGIEPQGWQKDLVNLSSRLALSDRERMTWEKLAEGRMAVVRRRR